MADLEIGEGDWEIAGSRAAKRNHKKQGEIRERAKKWGDLARKYPHIITPGDVKKMNREHGTILNLAEKFETAEWINLQKRGYKFRRVVKEEEYEEFYRRAESTAIFLNVDNKYGDMVCFVEL
jgi:hypothetical protein